MRWLVFFADKHGDCIPPPERRDDHPAGPLDFSLNRYYDQLVAGYTKDRRGLTLPEFNSGRILFLLDAQNTADWCIIYPENGKVVRVGLSPD